MEGQSHNCYRFLLQFDVVYKLGHIVVYFLVCVRTVYRTTIMQRQNYMAVCSTPCASVVSKRFLHQDAFPLTFT